MHYLCFKIQVITTNCAKHFCSANELPSDTKMFDDSSEWTMWQKRGDPVLHIELGKWADIFLIAPLDANSLAKLANVSAQVIPTRVSFRINNYSFPNFYFMYLSIT